jgi:hypothetical protein
MRMTARPTEYDSLGGHYQAAMVSGIITGALAAGTATAGHLFTFRWGHATRLAAVEYISVSFQAIAVFTPAANADFGFDAYALRSYSSSHTGGTAATLGGNSFKTRTSMGASVLTDMRIATTGALTAVGPPTADGNAFAMSIGDTQRVNPATPTEEQRVNDPTLTWSPSVANGEHPLVLATNEGFVIRNRAIWQSATTGSGIITVQVRWWEGLAY